MLWRIVSKAKKYECKMTTHILPICRRSFDRNRSAACGDLECSWRRRRSTLESELAEIAGDILHRGLHSRQTYLT